LDDIHPDVSEYRYLHGTVPGAGIGRFRQSEVGRRALLLAYHYITCSSIIEAIGQLNEVIQLEPKGAVAVQLLQMIGGPDAVAQSSNAIPPKPATPSVRGVDSKAGPRRPLEGQRIRRRGI
jgi:hypothetical protein